MTDGLSIVAGLHGPTAVEGPESPARLEEIRMYGSARITVLDRAVRAADRIARIARVFVRLATRTRLTPTDLYAAAATARFMAAHQLIEQAADAAGDDDEIHIDQIRQPLWFGATTIHEEN